MMSSEKRYTYNATDDAISLWQKNFTSRMGDGSGDPEEDFLSCVSLISQIKPDTSWLEIGCGLGRMIELLKTGRNKVWALEPDVSRYEGCKDRFRNDSGVEVLNSTSGQFRQENPEMTFELILNSMVLQHVSTDVCDQILCDIHDLLSDDGIAIISTTQNCKEMFTFQNNIKNHSRREFDAYAKNPDSQPYGIPVRKFTRQSFSDCIERAGLRIILWRQFSYIRPDKVAWFAQQYVVNGELIENVGDSQYAIVKRA